MKPIRIYAALLLVMGLGLTSCYKDTILPEATIDPDGPPQAVSYKTTLAPLFETNCAKAGCHVSGSHKPYLTVDVSYTQLVNNGYVNLLVPKESVLYQMINGEMKENMPSATDRQKVYDWIRNGAPNN